MRVQLVQFLRRAEALMPSHPYHNSTHITDVLQVRLRPSLTDPTLH